MYLIQYLDQKRRRRWWKREKKEEKEKIIQEEKDRYLFVKKFMRNQLWIK